MDVMSSLPERILRRLAQHPVMVISVASIGVRVGQDAARLRAGEIDGTEFRLRAGRTLGSISGGALGAAAGAVAGSVVPVLGSLLGGFAGGMLGEHGGAKLGRAAAEVSERWFRQTKRRPEDLDPPKRAL
jgi:phage tail tape-measure protein